MWRCLSDSVRGNASNSLAAAFSFALSASSAIATLAAILILTSSGKDAPMN